MPSACDRLARAADRHALRHEAALGADRHDHRVLDLLRLHQAEDFGAEILRPVGPADAAARHLAEAHVHALDARRIDEDLVERPRQRHAVELAAGKLDGDFRLRLAVLVELVVVGADRRLHRVDEAPHDAVLVEAVDLAQRGLDLGDDGRLALARSRDPFLRLAARIEARVKQLDDLGGERRNACATSPTCSPANRARGSGAGSARSVRISATSRQPRPAASTSAL